MLDQNNNFCLTSLSVLITFLLKNVGIMERLHIYLVFNSFIAFVENSTVTSHVL